MATIRVDESRVPMARLSIGQVKRSQSVCGHAAIKDARHAKDRESDITSARGNLGFGLSELIEKVRKGQRPAKADIEQEVHRLLRQKRFPEPPAAPIPQPNKPPPPWVVICAWDTTIGPEPLLFRLLNKAVRQLGDQVRAFLRSRSDLDIMTEYSSMQGA